jgi:outer membrane immunogenic protein
VATWVFGESIAQFLASGSDLRVRFGGGSATGHSSSARAVGTGQLDRLLRRRGRRPQFSQQQDRRSTWPRSIFPVSASLNGLGATGALATITAGYDYQMMRSFVAGVFGDYDFHSLNSELSLNIPSAPLSVHGEFYVNRQWSVGGRMGYLTSPSTLVFLSGGYTELSVSNFTANLSGGDTNLAVAATVPTIAGGFVGAGFETKLTTSVSLRGEYRFTDFGSGPVTLPVVGGTDLNNFLAVRVSPTLQTVKASVNYRF